MPNEDVKNFLLVASKFGQEMQGEIDLYITKDRLNKASFRWKFDPISKNMFRNQILLELVFKDISTFHAQNSIISSLIPETDIGKKDVFSKIIGKVPNPPPPAFELPPLDDLFNLRDVPNFLPKSVRWTGTQSKATFSGNKLIGKLKKAIKRKPKQKILADANIFVDLPKASEILLDKLEIELEKKSR